MSSKQFLRTKSSLSDFSSGVFQLEKKPECMEDECRRKRQMIKRKPVNNEELKEITLIVNEVLHSPGQLLNENTRLFMESR